MTATTIVANVSPLVMKSLGDGRSQAFRHQPSAATAGAIVGAVARNLLSTLPTASKIKLDDILNAASQSARARGQQVQPKSAPKFSPNDRVCALANGDLFPATVVKNYADGYSDVRWASDDEVSRVLTAELVSFKLVKGDEFLLLATDGKADRVQVRHVKGAVVAATYLDNGDKFEINIGEIALATSNKERTKMANTKPAAKAASTKNGPAKTATKAASTRRGPAAAPATRKAAAPAKAQPAPAAKGPRAKPAPAKPAPAKAQPAKAPAKTTAKAAAPAKAAPKAAAKAAPAKGPAKGGPKAKTVAGTKGRATVATTKGGGRGSK